MQFSSEACPTQQHDAICEWESMLALDSLESLKTQSEKTGFVVRAARETLLRRGPWLLPLALVPR
jgi:hypothetical protein